MKQVHEFIHYEGVVGRMAGSRALAWREGFGEVVGRRRSETAGLSGGKSGGEAGGRGV